jgi:hypothetical protein
MTIQVADAHGHYQKLVSVVKMATMPNECTTEQQRFVGCLLWAKGLDAKDIHKEIFLAYGGKCDFYLFGPLINHLGGKRFADDEEVER